MKSKSYEQIFEALKQKLTLDEIAEGYMIPGLEEGPEKDALRAEFAEFRKKMKEQQTPEEKLMASMLQLRFTIEDYLKKKTADDTLHFGYFLKEYITRLEKKNKEFAEEIGVDPAELSQVINRHRKPTDKLIYRLEIHSNENFPARLWFKLLEKERAYELTHNKSIIDNERKHVKKGLTFSFKKHQ